MTVLAGWVDEIRLFSEARHRYVPVPKRGGTWLYCAEKWEERPAGGGKTYFACLFRTKHPKTYRRHWRRAHGGRQVG